VQAADAEAGAKSPTLARRLATICCAHRLAGHETPTSTEVPRGIRHAFSAAPAQKAPATTTCLAAVIALAPDGTLRDLRDHALPLLGFSGLSAVPSWWRCGSST